MMPSLLLLSVNLLAGSICAADTAVAPGDKNMPRSVSVSFPGGAKVQAEVVFTADKMTRGLGNARGLAQGRGMFFLYPAEGARRFWMKNMLFNLDIIFMRHDGTLGRIFRNVPRPAPGAPDANLAAVEGYASYVLEVEAGFADKNALKEGMRAELNFSTGAVSAALAVAPAAVAAPVAAAKPAPVTKKAKGRKK